MRRVRFVLLGCCLALGAALSPSAVRPEKPEAAGEPADSFWARKGDASAVAFSPDSKLHLTGGPSDKGEAHLWDMRTMRRTATLVGCGELIAAAFLPDGASVVTASLVPNEDQGATVPLVALWDTKTGKRLRTFPVRGERPRIALSADGKLLATGGSSNEVKLWATATGTERAVWKGDPSGVRALAFSPDGKQLAVAARTGELRLWDVASGKALAPLGGDRSWFAASIAFSPDGKALVAGGRDEKTEAAQLLLWGLPARKQATAWPALQHEVIGALSFSADGKLLATGTVEGTVQVWDVASGKPKTTWTVPTALLSLALSPDGKWLATAGKAEPPLVPSGARLWDLTTGREKLSPAREAERARRERAVGRSRAEQARARAERTKRHQDVDRSPSAASLLAEAGERGRRAEYALAIQQAWSAVERWEFHQARALLNGLRPKRGEVDLRGFEWHYLWAALPREVVLSKVGAMSGAVSPDGKAVVLSNPSVTLYDVHRRRPPIVLEDLHGLWPAFAFSPEGCFLAVGGGKGPGPVDIKLWHLATGKHLATLRGHRGAVNSLAFSPDSERLCSTGPGVIKIWDVLGRKLLRTITERNREVGGVTFSPDGTLIAAISVAPKQDPSNDVSTPKVWDVATGEEVVALRLPTLRHSEAVAFSPDGRELAVGSVGLVTCWAVRTGQFLRGFKGESGALCYAPDGGHLLSGRSLFEAGTGKRRAQLEWGRSLGDDDRATVLATTFSPQGRLHVVTRERKHVRLRSFPITPPRLVLRGTESLTGLTFSDDNRFVLTTCIRRGAERWSATTGERLPASFWRRKPQDGQVFLSAKGPPSARLDGLDLSARELADLRSPGTDFMPRGKVLGTFLGVSPDQRTLVTEADWRVTLHDGRTGKPRVVLPFRGRPRAIAFSRDSKKLLTWDDDVISWDTQTGKELERIEPPGRVLAIAFAGDGNTLATLLIHNEHTNALSLWDVRTGEMRAVLRGHPALVTAAVFSPDGNALATADLDGNVRLWDALLGYPRGALLAHGHGNNFLAFRPDGRALAAGFSPGAMRGVWFPASISLWVGEKVE
jgi:WD40 repeat protein